MNRKRRYQDFLLPAAITLWVAWFAVPPLFTAWTTDVFCRGAAPALVIWCLSLIWILFDDNSLLLTPSSAWLSCAVLLCLGGVIGNLNILLHLALSASLMGLLSLKFLTLSSLCLACSSLCWMPATGWFFARFLPVSTIPWIRCSASIILAILTFLVSTSKADRKLRSHPPP